MEQDKPKPKGDTTGTARQSKRRKRLNEIAQAAGFASWSDYETQILNGKVQLPTQ